MRNDKKSRSKTGLYKPRSKRTSEQGVAEKRDPSLRSPIGTGTGRASHPCRMLRLSKSYSETVQPLRVSWRSWSAGKLLDSDALENRFLLNWRASGMVEKDRAAFLVQGLQVQDFSTQGLQVQTLIPGNPPCLFALAGSPYTFGGGAKGPVILPAFKAGDSALREPSGGFDSHTLPPKIRK